MGQACDRYIHEVRVSEVLRTVTIGASHRFDDQVVAGCHTVALEITEARMAELGMPNFGPEFSVSCENHGGSGQGKVQQWDASAKSWSLVTDWIQSDKDVITPLVMEDSMAFAAENNIAERCN